MKAIKRLSGVLKTIGIVLILVSLVLGIYVLINSGSAWNNLKEKALTPLGISVGTLDKARFDDAYFTSLSIASGNRELDADSRAEALRPSFRYWFE